MNVLIVGYGRMGREVEAILIDRGHTVSHKIRRTAREGEPTVVTPELVQAADAVIEFALPENVLERIRVYAAAKIPAVIGTTGWDAVKPQARSVVDAAEASLIHGSNFSLGAHMFFQLAERAAAMIADLPEYDIMVAEWHHKLKKDSPSGTALTTADRILRNLPRKTAVQTEKLDRAIRDEELHVASVRGGSIPGIHQILIDSAADTVEIKHTARNRSGFAHGAVLAAEWLANHPGTGFIEVEDFARTYFSGLNR
jgi:4-hydroxy-tetrahydrodipicolinate reductase